MGSSYASAKVEPAVNPASLSKPSAQPEEEVKRIEEVVDTSSVEGILSSFRTRDFLTSALQVFPPGTPTRWGKILAYLEKGESLVKDVQGIALHLTQDELMKALLTIYQHEKATQSDGLAYMRQYLVKMYAKHSLDRAQRISRKYRDEQRKCDSSLAYGEIEPEIFVTLYTKVCKGYGSHRQGKFYDLGCGVGNLVYAAAFVGDFAKCSGVEVIPPLLERGLRRMEQWRQFTEEVSGSFNTPAVSWVSANFLESLTWIDATFVFLHWTAFSLPQRLLMADHLGLCAEGTIIVSITHAVPSTDFVILVKDECTASWGTTDFYVLEKITPARGSMPEQMRTAGSRSQEMPEKKNVIGIG